MTLDKQKNILQIWGGAVICSASSCALHRHTCVLDTCYIAKDENDLALIIDMTSLARSTLET